MDNRKSKKKAAVDKDHYDRRAESDTKKAFKSVEKSVKPVAKDTNKTRRKETRARLTGPTVKKTGPMSNLKKDMKKPIMKGK